MEGVSGGIRQNQMDDVGNELVTAEAKGWAQGVDQTVLFPHVYVCNFLQHILNAYTFPISPSANLLKMGSVSYASLYPQLFAQDLAENTLVGKLMHKWVEIWSYELVCQ